MRSKKDCSWVSSRNHCDKLDKSRDFSVLAKFFCPDACGFCAVRAEDELVSICPVFDNETLSTAVANINSDLYDMDAPTYFDCDSSDGSVMIQYYELNDAINIGGWSMPPKIYAAQDIGDIRVDDMIFNYFTTEESNACLALISNACALITI